MELVQINRFWNLRNLLKSFFKNTCYYLLNFSIIFSYLVGNHIYIHLLDRYTFHYFCMVCLHNHQYSQHISHLWSRVGICTQNRWLNLHKLHYCNMEMIYIHQCLFHNSHLKMNNINLMQQPLYASHHVIYFITSVYLKHDAIEL